MSLYTIGLSTSGHDPAVAIANPSGHIIFAEATERFLQDKRAWGAMPDQVSHLRTIIEQVIESDPTAEFQLATSWSKPKTDLPVEHRDNFIPASEIDWFKSLHKQQQEYAGCNVRYLLGHRVRQDMWHFDHHLCHAANAVYSAPFEQAACLILDGEGEVGAASLFEWNEGQLKRLWRSWGPGSLGTFYAWLTELCGFSTVAGEEWKVMGLAAYGTANPILVEKLCQMMEVKDGRILWREAEQMAEISAFFESNFSYKSLPYMEAADLAASAQQAYSLYATQVLEDVYQQTSCKNLLLAGGCALNSAFNGTISSSTPFEQVCVPSAPADDGNALGAAVLAWQKAQQIAEKKASLPFNHPGAYLGSQPSKPDSEKLKSYLAPYKVLQCEDEGISAVASLLAQGKIIAVMRGPAEFGPRALGHRSILADPRDPEMKTKINSIVKGREAYRPFAPVIPIELADEWFESVQASPYMSFTLKWKSHKVSKVPAVVHKDGTGRLQTLTNETAPWLNKLTKAFADLTDIPVLLNTSFNVMGKPIVHSVNDALSVLVTTGLDGVLIENTLIIKE